MRKVIGLLVVIATGLCSCGQKQAKLPPDNIQAGYNVARIREADTSSVPMSMVRGLRLAKNGDILIASYLGVFRYDGKTFTNLSRHIISSRYASFWDVLEDRNGNLWLASKNSGVYFFPSSSFGTDGKFEPGGEKAFQHFTKEEGLASSMALHLYEDKAGHIWIGSSRYDGKTFTNLSTKDGFPSNHIRLLLEDKTGKLWFGAQGENLFVYDGKTYTILRTKEGQAFNNVWSVIEDKKGHIWFGANNGFWRYDGITFNRVSPRGAYAILQDKQGNIWTTGTAQPPDSPVWGLLRYDADSLYNEKPTVTELRSGNRMKFLDLLEANDGSIWYGSFEGVHRYDGKSFTDFYKTENRE